MFMKLTPGVNFTNIRRATFMQADPKSAKNTNGLTVFCALLGSTHIQVLLKMLVKLTPTLKPKKRTKKMFESFLKYVILRR
jgi:hypothetical protein